MRITVASIEADPSEIAGVPQLQELLAGLATGIAGTATVATEPVEADEISDIWSFLDLRGRGNSNLGLLKDFIRGCLEFDGAVANLGKSKSSPDGYGDYLMVRHVNHRKGAFVYVTPSTGKLAFRLQRVAAAARQHAIAVDTKDENYQVRVDLRSTEELEEALELAEFAYEGVAP